MTQKEMYDMLKYSFKQRMECCFIRNKTVTVAEEGFTGNKEEISGLIELPSLNGKEITLISEYDGAMGECSTSTPVRYKGTPEDALSLDLNNDYQRSAFVAVMNAVLNKYMLADDCIRCKETDIKECAMDAARHYKSNNGNVNVLLVGFQPHFLEELAGEFHVRVLDLDPDNIGKTFFGVTVEDGANAHKEAVDWAEVILCTGSVLTSGTMMDYINITKDIRYYGTTIAAAARVLSLTRFCPYSRN